MVKEMLIFCRGGGVELLDKDTGSDANRVSHRQTRLPSVCKHDMCTNMKVLPPRETLLINNFPLKELCLPVESISNSHRFQTEDCQLLKLARLLIAPSYLPTVTHCFL